MQTKETKTAKELQTKISNYLGGLEVIVYDDCMSGWTAAVIVPPGDAANTQQFVQIVSELRATYGLKEEPETVDPVHSETTAPLTKPGATAEEPEDNACAERQSV